MLAHCLTSHCVTPVRLQKVDYDGDVGLPCGDQNGSTCDLDCQKSSSELQQPSGKSKGLTDMSGLASAGDQPKHHQQANDAEQLGGLGDSNGRDQDASGEGRSGLL